MPRKTNLFSVKHGAFRKQLGYPSGKHIPVGIERDIMAVKIGMHVRGHTVTPLLKKRANFALNARSWKR
jgi:hypothetical protein